MTKFYIDKIPVEVMSWKKTYLEKQGREVVSVKIKLTDALITKLCELKLQGVAYSFLGVKKYPKIFNRFLEGDAFRVQDVEVKDDCVVIKFSPYETRIEYITPELKEEC